MTYEELGLDKFLKSNDSLSNTSLLGQIDINNLLSRGVLSTSFIKSIKADRIRSGTVDASVITVSNLQPEEIASGTYGETMNLGTAATGYIRLDGANNRIIVNDGTTNRIVIGNV